MKKLLLISLLIPVIVGNAQVALLDSVTFYSSIIDSTYLYRTIEYSGGDLIPHVRSYNIHDLTTGEVEIKYHFENDTLKQRINVTAGDTGYFQHTEDTIWFSMQNFTGWYHVNELYQIVETSQMDSLVWAGDNLLEKYQYGNLTGSNIYSGFNNPYFNVWKTFKGQYTASWYQVEFKGDVGVLRYKVMEDLHNYPTVMDEYSVGDHGEEVYIGTYYYYYTFILDVPEIHEYSKVLSVSYYNLLGQQTEKPKHGFYIERKVTDKGVISTKHYLK